MDPKIVQLLQKKLIGKRINMSLKNNMTYLLWSSFMPLKQEIKNQIGSELYSIEVYDPDYFERFDPNREFEKWAAVEVNNFDFVPPGLETIIIDGGPYSVFIHKGPTIEAPKTFQYIFETWLPNSKFQLDNRCHFEVMGEKYAQHALNSEEEIWVPVKY